MALYSEKVMDHFTNPRNVGKIDDADGVGEVGNARCGDIMKIYIKVNDGIITDVKFNTFGCGSAIASSSMATEMIKGKPISEALTLTNKAVAEALDGLPAHKLHCSVLAEEAIRAASMAITPHAMLSRAASVMKICAGEPPSIYSPRAVISVYVCKSIFLSIRRYYKIQEAFCQIPILYGKG